MIQSRPSAAPDAATPVWYYTDAQNQPVGPVSLATLKELEAAGIIRADTSVIEQGGTEWRTLAEVSAPPLPAPGASAMPSQPEEKTPRRWVSLVSLFFFYPIGLLLLWWSNAFSRRAKVALTVLFLPWFLLIVASPRQPKASAGDDSASSVEIATEVQPEAVPLKVGELGSIAAGAFVFTDLAARDELAAAQKADNSAKVQQLDEQSRAWKLDAPMPATISKTEGLDGLVELRGWLKNNKRFAYLTEARNVSMLPPVEKFGPGDEVELIKAAPLYLNRDLLLAARIAHQADDDAKMQELLPRLEEDLVRLTEKTRARVIEADPANNLYKIEGRFPDGSMLRRWARGRTMEKYVSPEEKQYLVEYEQQQRADKRLPEVKAQIEQLMKKTFGDSLRKVELNSQLGGRYFVMVDFNISDNFTTAMIKKGAEMKMESAYQKLFTTEGLNVRSAVLTGYQKLIDKYGKISEDRTYRTEMNDETAGKIVWENASSLDFTELWHTSFLHRALSE